MRSDDVVEVVGLQEAACDVRPELAAHASLARGPSVHRLKGPTIYKKSAILDNNRKGTVSKIIKIIKKIKKQGLTDSVCVRT